MRALIVLVPTFIRNVGNLAQVQRALVWPHTLSFFLSKKGTQILNISKYFTGLKDIVQPVLTSERQYP